MELIALLLLVLLSAVATVTNAWTKNFLAENAVGVSEERLLEQQAEITEVLKKRFTSERSIESFVLLTFNSNSDSSSIIDPMELEQLQRLLRVIEWSGGPFAMDCIATSQRMLQQAYAQLPADTVPAAHQLHFAPAATATSDSGTTTSETAAEEEQRLRMFLFDTFDQPLLGEEVHSSYFKFPLELRLLLDERHAVKVTFHLPASVPFPVELRWAHFRGNTRLLPLGEESAAAAAAESTDEETAAAADVPLILQPGQSVVQYSRGGHLFTAMLLYPFGDTADCGDDNCDSSSSSKQQQQKQQQQKQQQQQQQQWDESDLLEDDYLDDYYSGDYGEYGEYGSGSKLNDAEYAAYIEEVYKDIDDFADYYSSSSSSSQPQQQQQRRRSGYFGDSGATDFDSSSSSSSSSAGSGTTAEGSFASAGDDFNSDIDCCDCDCFDATAAVNSDPFADDLTLFSSDDLSFTSSSSTSSSSNEYSNALFHAQLEFDRVIGIFLVPAIYSQLSVDRSSGFTNFQITIDPFKQRFFNADALLQHEECATQRHWSSSSNDSSRNSSGDGNKSSGSSSGSDSNRRSSSSGSKGVEEDESDASMACFRRALLTYWEQQRLSQTHVYSWAVPRLPLAKEQQQQEQQEPPATTATANNSSELSTDLLYTLFSLPKSLQQQLKSAHLAARSNSSNEPPISQVFDQHRVTTRYVPLPNFLLQQLSQLVQQQAATWLGRSADSLLITSTYGSREYGSGAVVRWHVDPVELQPLTAIVHIAHHDSNQHHSSSNICTTAAVATTTATSTAAAVGGIFAAVDKAKGSCELTAGASSDYCSSNDAIHNAAATDNNSINNCNNSTSSSSVSWPLYVPSYLENFSPQMPLSECDAIHLKEGDVLLLQSAKLPHARLLPLQENCDWFANAFVHLAPEDWLLRARVQKLM